MPDNYSYRIKEHGWLELLRNGNGIGLFNRNYALGLVVEAYNRGSIPAELAKKVIQEQNLISQAQINNGEPSTMKGLLKLGVITPQQSVAYFLGSDAPNKGAVIIYEIIPCVDSGVLPKELALQAILEMGERYPAEVFESISPLDSEVMAELLDKKIFSKEDARKLYDRFHPAFAAEPNLLIDRGVITREEFVKREMADARDPGTTLEDLKFILDHYKKSGILTDQEIKSIYEAHHQANASAITLLGPEDKALDAARDIASKTVIGDSTKTPTIESPTVADERAKGEHGKGNDKPKPRGR